MIDFQRNKILELIFIKYGNIWQTIFLFATAIIIWQIYFPGLMSPDSIDQYGQALEGNFVDWHPPLMALVLSAFFKTGFGIGALIFMQCLLALFGLRNAISFSLRVFSKQGICKQNGQLIALISTFVFIIPFLTPFMFISVIFWKDAWLAIILLWVISYLSWIYINLDIFTKRKFIIHTLLLSLVAAMIVLVRHNAIVIIPVIYLLVSGINQIKFGKIGLIFGGLPLILLAVLLNPIIDRVFNVKHVKSGNLVVASDLTTMMQLYPELKADYPATIRHQNTPRSVPKDLIVELGNDNIELQNEYAKTFSTYPVQFLSAKFYRFGQMLTIENGLKQKLAYDIVNNSYGLKINDNYKEIRYKLNSLSSETGNNWYLIWISGLHAVWLSLNILLVIYFAGIIIKKRNFESVFQFLLLLISLSYYFSYLLAATTPDYRFMYPATLLMQVYTVSLSLSRVIRHKESKELLKF